MELIKQLNEMADELMDEETFGRLVRFALEDIKAQLSPDASDEEMLELIHGMIENIAGYEESQDAAELANRVLAEVKNQISF